MNDIYCFKIVLSPFFDMDILNEIIEKYKVKSELIDSEQIELYSSNKAKLNSACYEINEINRDLLFLSK